MHRTRTLRRPLPGCEMLDPDAGEVKEPDDRVPSGEGRRVEGFAESGPGCVTYALRRGIGAVEKTALETAEDRRWMREALAEALRAEALGEVPVGSVVVLGGVVVGRGYNRRESDRDPLAHAEVMAIRAAAEHLGSWRLNGCTLYATLEPCAMCAGALVLSRISRLVFGARDPKAGFCGSLGDLVRDPRLNHRLDVEGEVLRSECASVLREFFAALRRGEGRD